MTTKTDVAAWVAGYPRDFNQECVALCWQLEVHFGAFPSNTPSYGTANAVYAAAAIAGTDMDRAPGGAIGYYAGGAFGDVCVSMGDGTWLHASAHFHSDEMLRPGDHVGFLTDADYRSRSGYSARGWSLGFGSHPAIAIDTAVPTPGVDVVGIATYLNGLGIAPPSTAAQGKGVGPRYYTEIQTWGAQHGMYPQPAYKIDGKPGRQTFAVEAYLNTHLAELTTPAAPVAAPEPPAPVAPPEPPAAPPAIVSPPPIPTRPVTPLPAPDPFPTPPFIIPTGDPVSAPTTPAAPPAPKYTQADLDAAVAALKADSAALDTAVPGLPLAGLLASNVPLRKRFYIGFSVTSLLISFGPDLVIAGIITGSHVTLFQAYVGLATSVLLKIGTAFGFVAASNTK